MSTPEQQWLTLSQAALVLGVHPTTLRRWADGGSIPVKITPGGHRRFLQSDLTSYLQRNAATKAGSALSQEVTGRVWADFALVETRERLIKQPKPQWLEAFQDSDRDEKRELGRRLMALLMQHISTPDHSHDLLIEAKSIAVRYAQNCVRAGLTAAESLQATTFFRDTMTEVALQMPQVAEFDQDAQLRLLRKLNELFNVVQVTLVDYYDRADR